MDSQGEVLSEIRSDVAVIKNRCPDCQERLAAHDKVIYGNGGPGVLTRLKVLEEGNGPPTPDGKRWMQSPPVLAGTSAGLAGVVLVILQYVASLLVK